MNLAADGYDALSSGYGMAFNGGKVTLTRPILSPGVLPLGMVAEIGHCIVHAEHLV